MSSQQQQLILDLIAHRISEGDFLREIGIPRSEASEFSWRMLEGAYREKNEDDVECGLLVGFRFGFTPDFVDILILLSDAEWHHSHEDVVWALDHLRDRRAIEAFYRAALKLHPYLEYDEARALSGKAVGALGKLGDPVAAEKLMLLAQSDDASAKHYAMEQLHRRQITAPQPPTDQGSKSS